MNPKKTYKLKRVLVRILGNDDFVEKLLTVADEKAWDKFVKEEVKIVKKELLDKKEKLDELYETNLAKEKAKIDEEIAGWET